MVKKLKTCSCNHDLPFPLVGHWEVDNLESDFYALFPVQGSCIVLVELKVVLLYNYQDILNYFHFVV